MARVVRSNRALDDLASIWSYIATDSPSAADRLLDRFAEAFSRLAEFPEAGRDRPELASGLRSYPVGRYVLFYRPVEGGVEIARVLSAYRDIESLF